MNSRRFATLAGVIGVLGALATFVPGILLDSLFRPRVTQGLPGWLPTFGTIGETATLYTYAADIVGPLSMMVLAVGFGYYAGRRIDLGDEYRGFFRAIVAGTTIPLVVAWGIGIGAFAVGVSSAFNAAIVTALVLLLFATVSLPVIVGIFAGTALTHFATNGSTPPESDEASTDATPTIR